MMTFWQTSQWNKIYSVISSKCVSINQISYLDILISGAKSINENVEAIGAITKAFETFLNDISGFRKSLIAKREEIEQDPFVQDFEQSINEYTDIMKRFVQREDVDSPTHNSHIVLGYRKE